MPEDFLSTRLLPLTMDTVAAGVTQLRIQRFMSVYFVGTGTPGEWVLADTGLLGSEKTIRAAEDLYGP